MLGLKVTGDEHVRMGSVSMAVKIASGAGPDPGSLQSTAINVSDIPPGFEMEADTPLAGRGSSAAEQAEVVGCIVEAYSGFGTLAYEGYKGASFNKGIFLRTDAGKWCFHWGRNQQPVVFSRLPVRDGMSFLEATDARDD